MSEPGKRKHGRITFVVGLVLLVLAGVYLFADPEQLREFRDQIASAPLWSILVVVLGPIANWVCVGLCLHALMRRHGRVGSGEMLMLVGSAWLLNHLPMRPGLVGRIGYHAKVNQIRVRDSVEASVWSVVLAGVANAVILGLMLLVPVESSIWSLVLVLLIPLGVLVVLSAVAFMRSPRLGFLCLGMVYRYADVLVWAIRYAGAFAMLGVSISPVGIALITAASQFAQLIPFTGAGFGFREWGVGFAARLPASGVGITMRSAIGADVINRIAETIVVVPLGLVCTSLVAKRFVDRNADQTTDADSAEHDPAHDAQDQDQSGQPGE